MQGKHLRFAPAAAARLEAAAAQALPPGRGLQAGRPTRSACPGRRPGGSAASRCATRRCWSGAPSCSRTCSASRPRCRRHGPERSVVRPTAPGAGCRVTRAPGRGRSRGGRRHRTRAAERVTVMRARRLVAVAASRRWRVRPLRLPRSPVWPHTSATADHRGRVDRDLQRRRGRGTRRRCGRARPSRRSPAAPEQLRAGDRGRTW